MTSYSAREVDSALSSHRARDEWDDYRGGWDALIESSDGSSTEIELQGSLVTVTKVTSKDGDYDVESTQRIWIVIKIGSQYFKKEGYYSSYGGSDWDGRCREVEPQQRIVTVYE